MPMGKVKLSLSAAGRSAPIQRVAKRQQKECLIVDMQSHYLEMRNSQEISFSRGSVRELLYAYARPLVPMWDEKELYESVDEFLDGMEL